MRDRWSIYWKDIDGGEETRITPPGRDFFTPAAFHAGDRRVAVAFQDANKIRCAEVQTHPAQQYLTPRRCPRMQPQEGYGASRSWMAQELASIHAGPIKPRNTGNMTLRRSQHAYREPLSEMCEPLVRDSTFCLPVGGRLVKCRKGSACVLWHQIVGLEKRGPLALSPGLAAVLQADCCPVQWAHSIAH